LLPLGAWLCVRDRVRPPRTRVPGRPAVVTVAVLVGVIGGIYGIGGGSLLGPILVGAGMSVAVVAPAALAATFVTSLTGVAAYGLLSLVVAGTVGPDWRTGLGCGLGGLVGGYLGARLQPRVPEVGLRVLLGLLAVGLAGTYIVQAVRG
jgi:uncharacterized membrane protein YfcA